MPTELGFLDDDLDAPEGYRSAAAKSRLVIGVSIVSVIFFFAQFIVPQLISFYFMPSLMRVGGGGMFQVEVPAVDKAVIWKDQIRLPVSRIVIGANGPQFILKAADLSGEWITDGETTLAFNPQFLLPDGDKLWCVSNGNVAIIEAQKTSTSYPAMKLTAPSNPYLHEGRLRIVDKTPQGVWNMLEFAEGEWTVVGTMRTPANTTSLPTNITPGPVLTAMRNAQRLHILQTTPPSVLYTDGAACWTAATIPGESNDGDAVSALSALSDPWRHCPANVNVVPFLLEGRLAGLELTGSGPAKTANVFWLDDGKKEPFGTLPITFAENFKIVSAMDGRAFLLGDSFPPGRVVVTELTAAGFQGAQASSGKSLLTGRFGPFVMQYIKTMSITMVATWLMLLAFVVALNAFMATSRNRCYAFAHRTVHLATLWRRAAGRAIDTLIFVGPSTGLMVYVIVTLDVEALMQNFGANPLETLKLVGVFILGSLTYSLMMTVLFGALEGIYGWTPGKFLVGIRVVRTTLERIGIFRGMIRQLLLIIDGFFNYLIGGVMVAVSAKQQRLADLATDSIVVEAASLAESVNH